MTPKQSSMYNLGRQARLANFGRNACNLGHKQGVLRAFWLAGWHDQDMELSN